VGAEQLMITVRLQNKHISRKKHSKFDQVLWF